MATAKSALPPATPYTSSGALTLAACCEGTVEQRHGPVRDGISRVSASRKRVARGFDDSFRYVFCNQCTKSHFVRAVPFQEVVVAVLLKESGRCDLGEVATTAGSVMGPIYSAYFSTSFTW